MNEAASREEASRGERTTPPAAAGRPVERGVDRAVIAFFALAYTIAWATWALLTVLATDTGLDTTEFVARIEAGDLGDTGP